MTNTTQIEQQIRRILVEETDAIHFSNLLFSPNGLFNQIANTKEERRKTAESPLFKEAQKRLNELQGKDAAAFSKSVAQLAQPNDPRLFKLEQG